MNPETRKQATMGVGGVLLVLCCAAGPAILGAIGGAATGKVILGAVVAPAIAVGAYFLIRLLRGPSEGC